MCSIPADEPTTFVGLDTQQDHLNSIVSDQSLGARIQQEMREIKNS